MGREMIKRSKGCAKGSRCLKGGDMCTIMDNNFVAMPNEESSYHGKGTMVDIGLEVVEKLLLIR